MISTLLLIQKKKVVSTNNFSRWYTKDRVTLDDSSFIKTEAQLALWLFRTYGEGRYQLLAFRKGRKGFWAFWIGVVNKDGFVRENKSSKWMDSLDDESLGINRRDYEDLDKYYDDRENLLSDSKKDYIKRKRGPTGLIASSPPGKLYDYQEYLTTTDTNWW